MRDPQQVHLRKCLRGMRSFVWGMRSNFKASNVFHLPDQGDLEQVHHDQLPLGIPIFGANLQLLLKINVKEDLLFAYRNDFTIRDTGGS